MTVADLIDNPEFKSMMMKAYDKAFADGVQHERERCANIAETMGVAAFGDIPFGLIRQHCARIACKIRSGV